MNRDEPLIGQHRPPILDQYRRMDRTRQTTVLSGPAGKTIQVETILSQVLGPDTIAPASEEKRVLLSRLVARLAHEVRNPLSSLDIHVQLLQEDLAQPEPAMRDRMAGRLNIIRGELKRLEEIVENFLRLRGPAALTLGEVDVGRLLQHVIELVGPEAASRQIQISVDCPSSVGPLLADAGQLTQAVLNVVLNALQAVQRQGRIVLAARPGGEESLLIEVRDSGPGVPPQNRAAVFEPYFTTKEDGTGLGLWIAQQIVAAHGGTIQLENAPEGGAVFTFRLPLRAKETLHGQVENQHSGGG
jgi:two-component system sensor histidine kinase HydH